MRLVSVFSLDKEQKAFFFKNKKNKTLSLTFNKITYLTSQNNFGGWPVGYLDYSLAVKLLALHGGKQVSARYVSSSFVHFVACMSQITYCSRFVFFQYLLSLFSCLTFYNVNNGVQQACIHPSIIYHCSSCAGTYRNQQAFTLTFTHLWAL